MNFLNKEAENLLKECIENSGNFPQVLAQKFDGLSPTDDNRLRNLIKVLIKDGYFSKLQWADNVPWFGTITEKGYDYFHDKETYIKNNLKRESNFNLLNEESEKVLFESNIEEKSPNKPVLQKVHKTISEDNLLSFYGILGYNCGEVEPYSGMDKQMQNKGFVVHNGIPTLRGFAKISDLSKASQAKYEEYQRSQNKGHVGEIAEFLDKCKTEAKFLPEVVLSVNSADKAMLTRYSHKVFASASTTIRGAIDNLDYFILKVEEGSLSRVDGNHRLEAGKNKDYYVPFSIVVWGVNTENENNMLLTELSNNNTESEAFLFYILNNTAKRLEAEENFRGLVRSKTWTNDELALINKQLPILKHFDSTYIENPLLDKSYLPAPLSQVCEILTEINDQDLGINEFDTLFVDAIKLLGQSGEFTYCCDNFFEIYFQIAFYTRYKSKSFDEAIKRLKLINRWLEKYKYTGETFSKASKIVDVAYKFISSSPKTIFMAMEYKSEQIVADYNAALNRAVHTLNNMGGNVEIEAYPIMTGKGKSFSITEDIYKKIEECAIFIADTTEANPNVMYELGIAYSRKKPIIMVREKGKK